MNMQACRKIVFSLVFCLSVLASAVYSQEPIAELRSQAEKGHAAAQFDLGYKYAHGMGVPKDHKQAVAWYRKAAEQGYAKAQYNLGVKYANGEGVPKDDVLAYMWINIASASGNENALKARGSLEEWMTRDQIAEAHRLSREWLKKHAK